MRTSPYPLCCGKTIINGFGNDPNAADNDNRDMTRLQRLDQILGARAANAEMECALNGNQNAVWGPLLLARGMSLVASHNNNVHNSTIYTYYIGARLTLFGNQVQPAPDAEAIGVAQAREATRLAEIAELARQADLVDRMPMSWNVADYDLGAQYDHEARLRRGTVVQMNDPTVRREGVNGSIGRIHREYNGDTVQVMFENSGPFTFYPSRMRRATRRVVPDAPAVAAPILTEFFANLRNSGLRGPFTERLQAEETFPRCRSFVRRVVMSDGNIVLEEVV